MKRETMILLACASLLILVPACKRKDGCGIFTCGKAEKKVERKADRMMEEGMKKKAPVKKAKPAAAPKKVARKK